MNVLRAVIKYFEWFGTRSGNVKTANIKQGFHRAKHF